MLERNRKKLTFGLAAVLVVVIVVVVGVVIGLKIGADERGVDNHAISDANFMCNKVVADYKSDNSFTYDDAIATLKEGSKKGGASYEVDVIVCTAQFIYEYGQDFDGAVSMMNSAEKLLNKVDENALANYYATFGRLYERGGDEEKARFYMNKVDELFDNNSDETEEDESSSY